MKIADCKNYKNIRKLVRRASHKNLRLLAYKAEECNLTGNQWILLTKELSLRMKQLNRLPLVKVKRVSYKPQLSEGCKA